MASINVSGHQYNADYNFENIAKTFSGLVGKRAGELYKKLQSFEGETLDSGNMIALQADMQTYATAIDIQATLNKHLGDLLKGIVQKMN